MQTRQITNGNRVLPFEPRKKSPRLSGATGSFIDLFCGIGGFHQAGSSLGLSCVFASDIDSECRTAYEANYGLEPHGDITKVPLDEIPEHEMLCAGFPCQPFSIIGQRAGFADVRGTLFFYIAEILASKRPPLVMLENVKQLVSHDRGRTLRRILDVLEELGYDTDYKVLNALHFGIPQKRERVVIVGRQGTLGNFTWPNESLPMKPLAKLLEANPNPKHFASERIRVSRLSKHSPRISPSIWHENKAGNVASHPFSCALRAGASYNYLLVNGERRLTPREMLRLQGFPDSFKIVCNDSQTRKQAGNSVPVPVVRAVMERLLDAHRKAPRERATA